MAYTSWRGTVGLVKPTRRPGSLEELVRLLPEGVGVVPLLLNIRSGTRAEFQAALPHYEAKVAELAEDGVDLVLCSGTPPFMLQGYKGEAALLRDWSRRYGVPIASQATTHVGALRALGVRNFVGASYSAIQNEIVVKYMREAGFGIARMEPLDVPFHLVGQLSPEQVYTHIRKLFLSVKRADGIYIQGGGWRVLPIVKLLERDLGVPVVHSISADSWHIQNHLGIRAPVAGFGRLLAELPAPRENARRRNG